MKSSDQEYVMLLVCQQYDRLDYISESLICVKFMSAFRS